ncbi:MAG: hypothetical protein RR101_14745 [Burkholderiaceae bacterium]
MKKVSKSDIAKALGVSAPMVSKYVKAGMPVYSVEAAQVWREQNIDPSLRKEIRQPMASRLAAAPPQCAPGPRGARMVIFEDELISAMKAGRRMGQRVMLDWILENQAVIAAALIRHQGDEPKDAMRRAGLVAHTLHMVGCHVHQLNDDEIAYLCPLSTRDDLFARVEARGDRTQDAIEMAASLWPDAPIPRRGNGVP